MHGKNKFVIRPAALVACLLLTATTAGRAEAHRLEAEHRILADGRVQIESWFDLGGESPKGAKVQIFRTDGSLLVEGRLNDSGLFVFSCREAQPLRVVVSAGAGHRKEFVIPRADFVRNRVCQCAAALAPALPFLSTVVARLVADPESNSVSLAPSADRTARTSFLKVAFGVGLLVLVAVVAWIRKKPPEKRTPVAP
jgi:hypothetical protein